MEPVIKWQYFCCFVQKEGLLDNILSYKLCKNYAWHKGSSLDRLQTFLSFHLLFSNFCKNYYLFPNIYSTSIE